jgi:hypothetical protein
MSLLHKIRVRAFKGFEKLGVHATPNHFYEPVPDSRAIPAEFCQRPSELVGIEMGEPAQAALLALFCRQYKSEFDQFRNAPLTMPGEFSLANSSFGPVDAEILYCMVRHFKPQLMIEIGSGNSTLVSANALLKNAETGRHAELIAIEPFPNPAIEAGMNGLKRLIKTNVQSVPLSEFEALAENDILFIDSSHVLKEASDVWYEYLEILPRLKKGVVVHVHDIFLPFPYPKSWVVDELRFWNEQYLLQALLTYSSAFQVLWAGNYMKHRCPEALLSAFTSYNENVWPGSFWIKKIS